jgi:uncharacterized cupin superfamily protein
MTSIIRFNDLTPETTSQHPDEDKRIKGNPLRIAREYFANEVHGVRAGTWEAGPGAYRIALGAGKHELFHMLTGRVIISEADGGNPRQFAAGETGVIPPGFAGIFEIVEAASKFWVVTELRG